MECEEEGRTRSEAIERIQAVTTERADPETLAKTPFWLNLLVAFPILIGVFALACSCFECKTETYEDNKLMLCCMCSTALVELIFAIAFIVVIRPVKVAYTGAVEDAQAASDYIYGCSD